MARHKIKLPPVAVPALKKNTDEDGITFDFKQLIECSFTEKEAHKDGKFFIDFIKRLKALCKIGWREIGTSQRHGYGFETMPIASLNKNTQNDIRRLLSPDVGKLLVFRATGDNHVFLGYRTQSIFHILLIEYRFGDIYKHT